MKLWSEERGLLFVTVAPDPIYCFGKFELLAGGEELRKSGVLIHLQPQPLRVLRLLVSRAGEIVTRKEIREAVWGLSTFVDYEQGVNTAIRQIRRALNDTAEMPHSLQTIPRRGYRFIAHVDVITPRRTRHSGVIVLITMLGVCAAAFVRHRRKRRAKRLSNRFQ